MSAAHDPGRPVTLWVTFSEDVDDALLARCRQVLAPDELERGERFVFARDRRQHTIARALVRTALSSLEPTIAPVAWRFAKGELGRPHVDAAHRVGWSFSVSHTAGATAVAVAAFPEIGIDLEVLTADSPSVEDLAPALAPAERARVAALDRGRQSHELLRRWTLKEAYAKARGKGLSLDFRSIALDLRDPSLPRLVLDEALGDESSRWDLHLYDLLGRYVLATAIAHPARLKIGLDARRVVPFTGDSPLPLRPCEDDLA